jgi:hypothetical protein
MSLHASTEEKILRKISRYIACHHCNLHKGTNLSSLDPKAEKLTRLFHPRLDDWDEHFANRAGEIIGLSAVGRTTVNLLRMNEDGRLQLRESVEQKIRSNCAA